MELAKWVHYCVFTDAVSTNAKVWVHELCPLAMARPHSSVLVGGERMTLPKALGNLPNALH